jgi:hypothetical protein
VAPLVATLRNQFPFPEPYCYLPEHLPVLYGGVNDKRGPDSVLIPRGLAMGSTRARFTQNIANT